MLQHVIDGELSGSLGSNFDHVCAVPAEVGADRPCVRTWGPSLSTLTLPPPWLKPGLCLSTDHPPQRDA
eukprot:353880-Chlamydomonas_euryale.AAC.16